MLHAGGIKIISHDFPFRVDRIDLGILGMPLESGTSTVVKTPLFETKP